MSDERRNSSPYGPGLWPDARYDLVQDYTEPDEPVPESPAPGVAASVCPPLRVGVVIDSETGEWRIVAASRETWYPPASGGEERYLKVRLENTAGVWLVVTKTDGDDYWSIDAAGTADKVSFSRSPGGRLEGKTSILDADMGAQLDRARTPSPPSAGYTLAQATADRLAGGHRIDDEGRPRFAPAMYADRPSITL